jgi:hypothetical protein
MLQVPTSFSDLPPALTPQILSHVPQAPRLAQCAFVCRAWASAATLSTVHVESRLNTKTAAAFESWLQQHAGQLQTLKLFCCDRGYTSLRLPLGQLKQLHRLELDELQLQLPGEQPAASGSGQQLSDVAAGLSIEGSGASDVSLPSLQHLRLGSVRFVSTTSLLLLTAAPQLTSLVFRDYISFADVDEDADDRTVARQQVAAAVAGMLRQLPRLSVCELPYMPLSDAALQQLAAMQGLRQVSLAHLSQAPACDLRHLPSSIREMTYSDRVLAQEPSLPPQLQQLTGLLHLRLYHCPLPPTLLHSVTQLQTLCLKSCKPLPSGDPAGAQALLAVLSQLARLQHLEMSTVQWDPAGVASQHFSALTASSCLTRLVVNLHIKPPLPEGAVRHMFPAHRQQPQLKFVQLSYVGITEAYCIDSADLVSIASCCPALQHLDVNCTVQPGADVAGLLKLPHSCTSLKVGGAAFSDAAAATVAQLTQLKHLRWWQAKQLTDTGLQQLTALDLDSLDVWDGTALGLFSQLAQDPQKVTALMASA